MRNIRYFLILGIFAVLFIPLIVANSMFFPFITGKGFAFRFLAELLFGGWIILALTYSRYQPKRSWILWSTLAFLVVMTLADIFSKNPYKSFWSNFERMEGLVTLLHLGAYLLVTATVLNTERLWNWFWNTSIGVSLIMVLIGFLQLAGKITINQGGVRLDARFGNATYLAVYVLLHIFITLYLIVSQRMFLIVPGNEKKTGQKLIIGGIIIVLEAIILYYTATRGAMLGLIGGIGLTAFLIAIFGRQYPRIQKMSYGLIAVVVLVVGGFFLVKNAAFVKQSPVLSRFSSISTKDKTTESRFILWNMALKGFKERPILGWGQESFNYVFNKYYDPRLYDQEQWFDRTHNVIFDWLIAGGILGLLTYLSLYVAILYGVWKDKETYFTIPEKAVITGLLFGYFIHNLFVFDNLISYILFFSLAAYVYARTTSKIGEKTIVRQNRVIAPVAILVTIMLVYAVNARAYEQNHAIINAITPRANKIQPSMNNQAVFNGDVTENTAGFKDAIAYHSYGTSEAREQLLNAAEQVALSQTPINGSNDLIKLGLDEGKLQLDATPEDARYYTLLGSYLSHIGAADLALPYLQKAHELSPAKQSIMYELGADLEGLKKYSDALQIFKASYEADTANVQAKILYAAAALFSSNNQLADQLLKDVDHETIINSDYLINGYKESHQYNKVIEIWKDRVSEDPSNPQKHLYLAGAYLLIDDRKDAIAEIQTVITMFPAFKQQGDILIQQIQSGKKIQ